MTDPNFYSAKLSISFYGKTWHYYNFDDRLTFICFSYSEFYQFKDDDILKN